MANTVIALKKSATPSATPTNLANGELAINYADGKLFYKAANGTISSISGNEPNYFGTVNANNTLVVADTPGDILTLVSGNNISIVGDAVNDKVTVGLTNDVTVSGLLSVTASSGDEGGEIRLANAITNSLLAGPVNIDIYQNKLRFFVSGGDAKGAFINLAATSAGVGTDLLAAASATDSYARATASQAFDKANAALPNVSGTWFNGTLTASANLVADKILSTNNGNGENFKVGDDAWIGDFNTTNSIRIKGQQNPADGYINFGTGDTKLLGRSGTGPLTYDGSTIWHSGNSANASQAFDKANTANITADRAWNHANAAFANGNTTIQTAQSAFTQANSAYLHANAAHASANAGMSIANGAFASANAGQATANAAFSVANTALPNVSGALFNGTLNVSQNLSADKIIATNSGTGENFKVGDDVWLGDYNTSNSLRIKGQQNASIAYINFGIDDTKSLGRAGTGQLTYDNNIIWHQGNDGSGSGLDADLLDGQNGTYYGKADDLAAAYTHANNAFVRANTANITADRAWNHANAAFITANIAFANANTVMISAQAAFTVANSSFLHSNAAYAFANSITVTANLAFAHANAAHATANAAFDKANSTTYTSNVVISVTDNTNAALRITQTGTADAIRIEDETNPDATPFIVDATGRLIIGGTSTETSFNAGEGGRIQIQGGGGGANGLSFYANTDVAGTSTPIRQHRRRRTGTGAVLTSDTLSGQQFAGYSGTNYRQAAAIYVTTDASGTIDDTSMPGRISFQTSANGSINPTSRLEIDSSGNVIIGRTTSSTVGSGVKLDIAGAANASNLLVNGNMVFTHANDGSGSNLDADFLDGQHGSYYGIATDVTAAFAHANAAFANANTVMVSAQAAFTIANSSFLHTNAAYSFANSIAITANLAFAHANLAFANGNTVIQTAQSAFNQANLAFIHANNAFASANAGQASGNAAQSTANAAFNRANTANITADRAWNHANSAFASANIAFANANTVMVSAQAAFTVANSAFLHANSGYAFANSIAITANLAFAHANASYAFSNSAHSIANNAYAHANAAFLSSNGVNTYTNSTYVKLTAPSQTITGDLEIVGILTLSGNTVFIDATRLQIDDPLIYLAGNNYTSDIVDIGFIANYVNATGQNVHTGLYREHENKEYYLFQGYDKEPANNHIGAFSNNMTLAVLNADIKTSNLILGGVNAISTIGASFNHANAAHASANAGMAIANGAFASANAGQATANAAFNRANTANITADRAWNHANAAFATANIAFANANTVMISAQAAFTVANSGFLHANAAFATVNSAFATINVAFANANTVMISAQAAFTVANAAFLHANAAFIAANADYSFSNSAHSIANLAFTHANAAFLSANTARTVVNDSINATRYLMFANGTSGTASLNVAIGLSFNPSSNTLNINGPLNAVTKSFLIGHPTKDGMKLRYGSLEGPENGVYVRGRAQGPYIYLPDYWLGLVDRNSITVSLTPIAKTEMPSVLSYNNEKIVLHSNSSIDCFYHVFAERKDVDKLVVEF